MANIVGIQAFSFNQAAALVSDGKLSALIEEEKLNRRKGEKSNFPEKSLEYCFESKKIKPSDIAEVVLPWKPDVLLRTSAAHVLKEKLTNIFGFISKKKKCQIEPVNLFFDRLLVLLKHSPFYMKNLTKHYLRFESNFKDFPKISFVPHHYAHAASSYLVSGLDRATIIVFDGLGDSESTSVWSAEGLNLKLISKVSFPNSLGEFYAAFTQFLGFKPYQNEGKLMGLAAYGKPDPIILKKMEKVIRITKSGYAVNHSYTIGGAHSFGNYYSDDLIDLFGEPKPKEIEFNEFHQNLAFAVQNSLELAAIQIVKNAIRETGIADVCLAGGVSMNCKMNGVIRQADGVRSVFVNPAATDAGAALGGALLRSIRHGHDPRFKLEHAYYGPGFSDAEIESALAKTQARYKKIDLNSLQFVADELIKGKVIGLFQGRSEFGARALGARSIIANPMIKGIKDRVNQFIKFREPWRPFAPAILESKESEYFEHGENSPFMMKAYRATEKTKKIAPDIVHVDGTCRPQSVGQKQNPVFYEIIQSFYQKTGTPILLNTSFNLRGEPIVSSPQDAIRTFYSSKMDGMLMGSYWVS